MDIIKVLQEELKIGRHQVEAAVKLIDEGNTIPFIARYRKEATGSLDDEILRTLDERLRYLRNLAEKKEQEAKAAKEEAREESAHYSGADRGRNRPAARVVWFAG